MKIMLRSICAIGFALLSYSAMSQRYITEQFTQVNVYKNVCYDTNMAVNIIPPNNPPLVKQGLLCDVYEPQNDNISNRPLIIIMPTGSFLPAIINKQTTGNKEDSAVVEMCMRFARKGYVAVAMNYRIGWNPTVLNADTATAQLLQATYRGIQDAKNCVRYFNMNAGGYKIDTTRIALGGIGTGGYIALAYATIDKQEEIELEKFRYSTDPYPPMVNTAAFGNWDGFGGAPFLNIPGDPIWSTEIAVAFHIGGAMGDISWMDGNEVPILSVHCVLDPYAPYTYGNVIIPTTGVTVINQAAGGKAIQDTATFLGINDIIENRDYQGAVSVRAKAINGGNEGLYPLILDPQTPSAFNQSAPWEWWDSTVMKSINFPYAGAGAEAHRNSMYTNNDMSKDKAMKYIDTLQEFLCIRIVCALDLPGCPAKLTSLNTLGKEKVNVYPNPNHGEFRVQTVSGAEVEFVEIFDILGKQIYTLNGVDSQIEVNLSGHPTGIYMVKIHTSTGTGTARVVIH